MNCSLSTLVLAIFFAFLSNCNTSLGHMKLSDSGLQNWENEDMLKHDVANDSLERMQGESWHTDHDEDQESKHERRTYYKERKETGSESLNKLNNELVMEDSSESPNSPVNRESHRQRQQFSHSPHGERRRHRRKFKEEIKTLHNELSHVVEDLKEVSAREEKLEHVIDELSRTNKRRGKLKCDNCLGKHQAKNGDHHSSDNENKINEQIVNDTFHSFEEDSDVDPTDTEVQDLENQDAGSQSNFSEVVKDSQQDFADEVNENDEIRRKNRELCRLLHLSLTRQRATHESHNSYEDLDENSSGNTETLEDQFLKACGPSFREKEIRHRKKPKPHSSQDSTKTEMALKKHTGHREKIRPVNKKSRRERQFPKSQSTHQDTKQRRRQSLNQDGERHKSEQRITPRDESISRRESDEDIILGDMTEMDERGDKDNEKSGSRNASASRSPNNSTKEDAVSLTSVDDNNFRREEGVEEYQDEEETNVTISTDHEDKQKVYYHIAAVDEAAFCGKPRPVVIYPSDHYPVPNKYYTPQATILHRCSKHSGCCPIEKLTCVPAKKENVVLHFFAAVLDGTSSIVPHVEKLRFVNHTKCGCVFKHRAHLYL